MRKLTLFKKILALLFMAVFILTAGMSSSYAVTNPTAGVFELYPGSSKFDLIDMSNNDKTAVVFGWYGDDEKFYAAIESQFPLISMTIDGIGYTTNYTYAIGTSITIGGMNYFPDQKVKHKDSRWTVCVFDQLTPSITHSYSVTTTSGGGHTIPDGTFAVEQKPAMTITKTASPATYSAVGQIITYTYTIYNTGNTNLTPKVTDNKISGTISVIPATIAPTDTSIGTATYIVTQADIESGSVTNTAYATDGSTVSNTATATVNAIKSPAMTLTKTASPTSVSTAGQVITYTYNITNSGNTMLNTITVTDDKIGNIIVAPQTLAPGATATGTKTYTVTQEDIDAGSDIVNTATATSGMTTSNTVQATVTISRNPAMTITKSAFPETYNAVGQVITYTYTVTNTGNTVLHNLVVNDDKINGSIPVTLPVAGLVPGATVTATAIYYVTQADIDTGTVTNTASATDGTTRSNDAWATVTAIQKPVITITKTVSQSTYDVVGQTITYNYTINNIGNTTLIDLMVWDDILGDITVGSTTINPGGSTIGTKTYNVNQTDIDNGSVTNIVTATATGGLYTVSDTDTVTITADKKPALTLFKTADTPTYNAAGQKITYTYSVKNTGNTTLNTIMVYDNKLGNIPVTLPSEGLAPNQIATATATYTVTQDELDNGTAIINLAHAESGTTHSNGTTVTVTAVQNPSLTITKTASLTTYTTAGTDINYTMTIENTGNQTLHITTLTDITDLDIIPNNIPLSAFTESSSENDILNVSEIWTYTYNYTTTQTDVDTGVKGRDIVNTITVDTNKTEPQSDTATVTANADLGWSVTKAADKTSYNKAGIDIGYTVIIINTEEQTVTGILYDDSLDGITEINVNKSINEDDDLDYGETWTLTYTYTTTQDDVDTDRPIINVITVVTGNDRTKKATDTVTANGTLTWTLTKIADMSSYDRAGTEIYYTVTITNTGTKTVTALAKTDSLVDISGVTIVRSIGSDADNDLDVGETWTLTYTYTTTLHDLYIGRDIDNIVTVDPANDTEKTATVTIDVIPMVLLTITKTASGANADPEQSFIFTVTGNGINVRESIQGSGSKTIRVPANGTYTVTEDTGWSWRYTADNASQEITLTGSNNGIVYFTNTLTEPYRLSDETYRINTFAPAAAPTAGTSFTPVASLLPEEFQLKKKTAPAVEMV